MDVPHAIPWLAARLDSPGPPGRTPLASSPLDFSDYPSSSLQQLGFFVLFFFPTLSLLIVALRLYGRLSTKTFGWDDVFIIPALLTALAEAPCSYLMMKLLFIGVHTSDIPIPRPKTGNLAGIMNYIVVMLYNPQLGFVKSSVLFFLLRIGGHKTGIRCSIHILNIVNLAMLVAVFMASVFTCVPIAKYWDKSLDGHCNSKGLQYIVTSSITVLTDVAVLVLPFIIVVGLQRPRRLKIGLLTLLCLGLIATVFSVLRLLMLVRLHYGTMGPDATYNIDFVYSTVECNLAIICASIPALSNFLKQWCPRFFSKTSGAEADMPYLEGTDYSGSGATKTIGGTSMVLKTIKVGYGRSGYVRRKSLTRSEEEILGVDRAARAFEHEVIADDRHAPHEDAHLACYYTK